MAQRGGKRKGAGRQRGQSKVTIERALIAQRIMDEQRAKPGKKLAREVMEDFMHLFAGMAAVHQPLPPGVTVAAGPGRVPDKAEFLVYAKLAMEAARDLADYQSPKMRSVLVHSDPSLATAGGHPVSPIEGAVSRLEPMEAYRMLRDSDVIDVSPEAQMVGDRKVLRGKGG